MDRRRGFMSTLGALLCAFVLLSGCWPSIPSTSAQPAAGADQVRASVHCDGSALTITIENDFWNSIGIAYVTAFGGPANPIFLWTETDPALRVRIEKGDWRAIEATVMEQPTRKSGPVVGALVVTTAGVLMPACDGGEVGLMDSPGESPADINAASDSLVALAMLTIGRLESLRAWDALYALLHPDVQDRVPPVALACWYAGTYGTADNWKDSVINTKVDAIATADNWDWIAGGITYDQAVEVTYTQTIGTLTSSHPVEATMHFVQVDQEYRWFFGNRVDSLNHLDTDCGL